MCVESGPVGPGRPGRMRYRVLVSGKPTAKGRARVNPANPKAVPYTPKATVVAEAWVRMAVVQAVGSPRVPGPVALRVVFVMPIPKSGRTKAWRQAAAAGRILHIGKPDADNLLKLVSDALNGIAWEDDAAVASAEAVKVYGPAPQTVVEWWQMTPAECQAAGLWARVGPGMAELA